MIFQFAVLKKTVSLEELKQPTGNYRSKVLRVSPRNHSLATLNIYKFYNSLHARTNTHTVIHTHIK